MNCGFCNKLSVPRWTLEWVMKDFFCSNFDKQTISRFISIHFNIHNYRLLIIFFNVFIYIISSRTIVERTRSTGWWNVLLKKKLNMTNKSAAVSISSLVLIWRVQWDRRVRCQHRRRGGYLPGNWLKSSYSSDYDEHWTELDFKKQKEANHKRGKYFEVPDSDEVTNWCLWDKVQGKV